MFSPEGFVKESIAALREEVDDIAVIACSGGVDSTVAAVIADIAVGQLLHCVYVDTGFMRKNETEEIQEMLAGIGLNLTVIHAEDRYFAALEGITEPEQKRKVIGELFIRIFEEEQDEVGAKYLIQGTIAPDWIESGGGCERPTREVPSRAVLPEVDGRLTVDRVWRASRKGGFEG